MDDATDVPDASTNQGDWEGKTTEFAGSGPPEPDPPPGLVSGGPVVRSDLGPDFSTDVGGMVGAGGVGAHGADPTAPAVNPVQPGPDDDLDRNPDVGVQNTRANF